MAPEEVTMRKTRSPDHQSIAILKSVGAGRIPKDVCREIAITTESEIWRELKGKFMRTRIVA